MTGRGATVFAAWLVLSCTSLMARASPFVWGVRIGGERMSEPRGPEWGGFVEGEAGVRLERHVSLAAFGVVARTTDEHGFRGGPVSYQWTGDHFRLLDVGLRFRIDVGATFFGLGIGSQQVTQSGTLTYLFPPPVESSAAPETTDASVVDVHAGYVLPRLGEGSGWCLQLFAAFDHEIASETAIDALRFGIGIASRSSPLR